MATLTATDPISNSFGRILVVRSVLSSYIDVVAYFYLLRSDIMRCCLSVGL